MKENFVKIDNDYIFLRHNDIAPDKRTLLFVHGLGESGLCFQEVFDDKRFNQFNVLVPDMIGYGKSSRAANGDYSFDSQVKRVWKLLEMRNVSDLVVIGHSIGGDISTLLCTSDKRGIIKKHVNIEGDITRFDVFISNSAVEAADRGRFMAWFQDEFVNNRVYEQWGEKYVSCRRYYASLCFCEPDAFLANARELVERYMSLSGRYGSEIGRIYVSISIPKVFCCGALSISPHTIDFLKENNLEYQVFQDASHWLMIDKAEEFYSFLYTFVSGA